MEALLDGGVLAVGVAVDEGHLAQAINPEVGVIGQDHLGARLLGGAVDGVLDVLAIVADEGRARRRDQVVQAVLMIAPEVDGRTEALEEVHTGLEVGLEGLAGLRVRGADAPAQGTEVEVVAPGDADGRLVILAELPEGGEGLGVGHVAMGVGRVDEADGLAHTFASISPSSTRRRSR